MTLSLDTASVIDLIRGRDPGVRQCFQNAVTSGQELVLSAVVMHELLSGVATSRDPAVERARMTEALVGIPVVDLTAEDVELTSAVAGRLRRAGRPIGDLDTLIAGQALSRGWTVVTRNIKHFGRVEGLSLIDWTMGAGQLSVEAVAARVQEGE